MLKRIAFGAARSQDLVFLLLLVTGEGRLASARFRFVVDEVLAREGS